MRAWSIGSQPDRRDARPRLLIAGASVRAAVWSAIRSGLGPVVAADLFNDRDLRAVCPTWRLKNGYKTLPAVAQCSGADAWIYTGALENHASLVATVSQHLALLGNGAERLRQIREPALLANALRDAALPFPLIATRHDAALDQSWLRKPRNSAAGLRIRRHDPQRPPDFDGYYYQRFVEGIPRSAVFIAAAGRAKLLGVTDQLIGEGGFGASHFQYVGSLGPISLSFDEREQWCRIGQCLAERFGLVGLFGVDAIVNADGVCAVEVNPRYTASVEILERCAPWFAIALHCRACRDGVLPAACEVEPADVLGKAIVFVRQATRVSPDMDELFESWNQRPDGPWVADIPELNRWVESAHPIVTVFAREATAEDVKRSLQRMANEVFAFGLDSNVK